MEYKAFPLLECKSEGSGRFTGYAAAFTKDAYGDQILPGAFARTIKKQKGKIPIFLNHDPSSQIGYSTELVEDAKGLYIDALLCLESSKGADAYALLQTAKTIDYRMGLSIGFIAEDVDFDEKTETRTVKVIDLWETSITPFPANRNARVESVKSIRNVEQILRDVGGCSKEGAKRTLACLQPYLSADADGNQPNTERDARLLRRADQSRLCNALRAAIGG